MGLQLDGCAEPPGPPAPLEGLIDSNRAQPGLPRSFEMTTPNRSQHIRLTSHPEPSAVAPRSPIRWGAATAAERGPLIGTATRPSDRNVDRRARRRLWSLPGARRLVGGAQPARQARSHQHQPGGRHRAAPAMERAGKIVSLDPFGHVAQDVFAREIAEGLDIRPTIAVTKARLNLPEIFERARREAPQGRPQNPEEVGRNRGHQGRRSIRSGICRASPSASGSPK